MQFTPQTDAEIAESRLLPDGEYDFQITWGLDKVSKSGNDMIEIELMVFKPQGGFITLRDYLMPSLMYKLSHAAKVCGLEAQYNAGNLTGELFSGKVGRLKLGTQPAKDGYDPKNTVKDYIMPEAGSAPVQPKKVDYSAELGGDDIPF